MSDEAKTGSGFLADLTVIECGEGVAAAFAAKMLADLGANVIKVEPPGGDYIRRRGPFPNGDSDPDKSGLFLYLNNNKRSVTIDLARAEGRGLLGKLLARADILVHNVAPRERAALSLVSETLAQDFPDLIIAGISPFGDRGRYKDWNAYALNLENAGGMAFLAPGASQAPDRPPLKAFGQQPEFQGGLHACYAALTAYWSKLSGVRTAPIEVSEQECIAAMLELNFMHYTYRGRETSRLGKRILGPWLIADCADGPIFVACADEAQWNRMVEVMGNPEWAHEEIFKDRLTRGDNADALNLFIREWAAGLKKREVFKRGQGMRVPFATVNSMKDIYEDDQLNLRDYFVTMDYPGIGKLRMPGAPAKYSDGGWSMRTLAPRLGQHNEDVFGELGIARNELDAMRRAGVI